MDKCDFELLLRRPLREIQGRLLSLMHAGRIPHSLHFALGGPVTDEATYRAQHDKNLHALENGFYEPLPPVFPTQETAFFVLQPAQSNAWLRDILALGLSIAPIQAYIRERIAPFLLSTRTAPAQARALFEHLLQRQEADYASRADADVYARMRCVLNPCWMYIWNAWKRCPSTNRATAIWLTRPSAAWRNASTKARCRCRRFPTVFSSFSYNPPVSGFLIKRVWDEIASSFYQIMERMSKVQL